MFQRGSISTAPYVRRAKIFTSRSSTSAPELPKTSVVNCYIVARGISQLYSSARIIVYRREDIVAAAASHMSSILYIIVVCCCGNSARQNISIVYVPRSIPERFFEVHACLLSTGLYYMDVLQQIVRRAASMYIHIWHQRAHRGGNISFLFVYFLVSDSDILYDKWCVC